MADSIPKVQQKAIEQIASGTLSSADYRYLLHEAAEKGWAEVLREAIRHGESRSKLLDRMLHEASNFGRDHAEAVQVLLSAGANPNAANVMDSCGVESLPILIKAGGNIDIRKGRPLLEAIINRTKQDKALALIEVGANVNVADRDGVTAVMHAAAMGRGKVYDALVKAGADLYAVDKTGRSLARQIAESMAGGTYYSTESDRKKMVKIARGLQSKLPAQPEDQILLVIVAGDVKELTRMLGEGLDSNTMFVGGLGLTGFTFQDAVEKMKQADSIVEALQAGDFIPTKQERDAEMGGMSILMWATAIQQVDCIRVLLEHGADPTLKNQGGLDALTIAEKRTQSRAIVQLLRSRISGDGDSPAASTNRCQILGLSQSEVEKELAGSLDRLIGIRAKKKRRSVSRGTNQVMTPEVMLKLSEQVSLGGPGGGDRETPPENRGYWIDRRWEVAQLHYVLEEANPCQKLLMRIVKIAEELFFGEHLLKPCYDCTAPLPHTAQWKAATDNWMKCFPRVLAACGVLGDWKFADRLLTYPDKNCERGEKSPRYNPEWYEWPLWMHLGAVAREEQPQVKLLEGMKQHSTRRSKAVLGTYLAITDGKLKQAQKAIDRIVQAHIAEQKKWCKAVFPSRCVSPEATYFFHLAHRSGLDVEFLDSWNPYVLQIAAE